MTDPKRKLPVLPEYVFLSLADGRFGEYWETTIADGKEPEFWPGTHAVRFEPAVPRCKTCRKFIKDWEEDTDRSWYYCPELESDEPFPQDGSGYCHMHTELRR